MSTLGKTDHLSDREKSLLNDAEDWLYENTMGMTRAEIAALDTTMLTAELFGVKAADVADDVHLRHRAEGIL